MRGKGRGPRLPLFSGPGSAAAGDRRPHGSSACDRNCRNCRRPKEIASSTDYGLPAYDADLLTTDRELADYFETCLETFNNPKPVSNWIMGPLLGLLNTAGKSIDASPVSPENLGRLLQLIEEGVISGKIAKTVFDEMAVSGHAPDRIVKERGLVQVSDASHIETAVEKVMAENASRSAGLQGRQNQTARLFRGPGDARNQGQGQSPGGQ